MLFVAFVLTPEFMFPVVALGVAVVGLRVGRRAGSALASPLLADPGGGRRWGGAAGVFALWLLANGALDDFVFYFRTFAPDHELTGAFPIDVDANGSSTWSPELLPWLLAVVTGAFFAWRFGTARAPCGSTDWVGRQPRHRRA